MFLSSGDVSEPCYYSKLTCQMFLYSYNKKTHRRKPRPICMIFSHLVGESSAESEPWVLMNKTMCSKKLSSQKCVCVSWCMIFKQKKGISGYGLKSKGPSVDINKKCTAYENEVYLIYINFALFYNSSNYVIYKRLS